MPEIYCEIMGILYIFGYGMTYVFKILREGIVRARLLDCFNDCL